MKVFVSGCTFDASAREITFPGTITPALERILLIANTTNNVIIYNFTDTLLGGTIAGQVLTLTFDTSTMDDSDALLVYYDNASASLSVSQVTGAKTVQTDLLGWTAIAANAQQKSSELDTTTMRLATLFIAHARDAATAFVGAGTEYRVEVSTSGATAGPWRTLYSIVADIIAASSIVTDGIEAIGQTRIETGATLPAVGDLVFFKHGTIALSEQHRVIAKDATGGAEYFDIIDALISAQPQQTMFNRGEQYVLSLDLRGVTRLRVVVNNNNGTTNQAICSRVAVITGV